MSRWTHTPAEKTIGRIGVAEARRALAHAIRRAGTNREFAAIAERHATDRALDNARPVK